MSDTRTRADMIGDVRERTADILSGFTLGQKTVTVISIVGLLAAGMFFMRWVSEPDLAPLFSGLSGEDAAAITDELDVRGIEYQLADGGRTILVPRGSQLDLRLDMSSAGLMPSDTTGYALLDDNGITTSDFQQRVDYQRAIEGELARTIGAMDAIDSAAVHLVIPEEDLFTQDNEMATASVLLTSSQNLTPMQVQAIVNLVAGSIEGLDPTAVSITDTAGNVLFAPGEDGQMGAAGDMRQYQTSSFESKLSESVQRMLQQVVGPNAAVVTVTADLNFDRIEQVTETFGSGDGAAEGGIPLESTTTSEVYEGTGSPTVGVLGPDGNPLVGGEGDSTSYELSDGTTRFAVDRTVQEILSAPGSVNRLSVAVLLDANATGSDAAEVQALVEAAVGFNGDRGDMVEVTALPFDASAAQAAEAAAEAAAAAQGKAQMFELIRTIGSVLIVMIVLFLAWRSAKKTLPQREIESIPLDLEELNAGEVEDEPEEYVLEPLEIDAGPTLAEEVGDLIDEQGDDMAGLLRGWMAEKK